MDDTTGPRGPTPPSERVGMDFSNRPRSIGGLGGRPVKRGRGVLPYKQQSVSDSVRVRVTVGLGFGLG